MSKRPHAQSPSVIHPRLDRAMEALDGLAGREQLRLARKLLAGLLLALRPRFEKSREAQVAFDLLCDETLAQLRADISRLRFTRPH